MKTIKYIVQKGDTLWAIGKKYNIDWEYLAKFNHLDNPHLIYPNDKILIPAPLWRRIGQLSK
ncbi:MAG: LysM domain-containing protein [Bacteroidales bacterium]|jgi:LysM repeat protein|nr:LysM domain-containing protein [Bacteroidales bacterium]